MLFIFKIFQNQQLAKYNLDHPLLLIEMKKNYVEGISDSRVVIHGSPLAENRLPSWLFISTGHYGELKKHIKVFADVDRPNFYR